MGDKTGIQWSGMYVDGVFVPGGTLNIGGGCTKISAACTNCYAMAVTAGLARKLAKGNRYEGLTKQMADGHYEWTNLTAEFPERLEPLVRRTSPKPWFISSLTDVFHKNFSDDYLIEVFGAFVAAHTQRLYVLTKRPERQAEFLLSNRERILAQAKTWEKRIPRLQVPQEWPAKNIWTGASAGTQEDLETIIPDVLRTPSAVQWLSLEPLIGAIDLAATLRGRDVSRLKWVVTGGESGERARPMKFEWARSIINDCRALDISPFFKQKGEVLARETNCKDKKGGVVSEWPADLQVREWPM